MAPKLVKGNPEMPAKRARSRVQSGLNARAKILTQRLRAGSASFRQGLLDRPLRRKPLKTGRFLRIFFRDPTQMGHVIDDLVHETAPLSSATKVSSKA